MSAAAGEARRFPWDDVIALGLGLLRLSSRDFWAMTPREIALAMRPYGGDEAVHPPGRETVTALMTLYPDI